MVVILLIALERERRKSVENAQQQIVFFKVCTASEKYRALDK